MPFRHTPLSTCSKIHTILQTTGVELSLPPYAHALPLQKAQDDQDDPYLLRAAVCGPAQVDAIGRR